MSEENEMDACEVIGRTIVQQLCGDAEVLRIMLGVKVVGILPTLHPTGLAGNVLEYPLEGGIVFGFEQIGECEFNVCQIGLTGRDDYTMEFGNMKDDGSIEMVCGAEEVYADELKTLFEINTGMMLDVPVIIFIG